MPHILVDQIRISIPPPLPIGVKGFTRSILFGGPIDPDAEEGVKVSGIADMLTVFGDGKAFAISKR